MPIFVELYRVGTLHSGHSLQPAGGQRCSECTLHSGCSLPEGGQPEMFQFPEVSHQHRGTTFPVVLFLEMGPPDSLHAVLRIHGMHTVMRHYLPLVSIRSYGHFQAIPIQESEQIPQPLRANGWFLHPSLEFQRYPGHEPWTHSSSVPLHGPHGVFSRVNYRRQLEKTHWVENPVELQLETTPSWTSCLLRNLQRLPPTPGTPYLLC